MSDQGTGHESGAKVGTVPRPPPGPNGGRCSRRCREVDSDGAGREAKPPGPRRTMIGVFRVLMTGLKSLWARPCPPHDQMVAITSWTTTHNDRGRISFSFPSLSRSVDIIVLFFGSVFLFLLVWPKSWAGSARVVGESRLMNFLRVHFLSAQKVKWHVVVIIPVGQVS